MVYTKSGENDNLNENLYKVNLEVLFGRESILIFGLYT